jgi:hypothetical protein
MTDVDVLPFDTSWLFEPTTGVHQFGGGSGLTRRAGGMGCLGRHTLTDKG